MIDLSHLTEEEQAKILRVLQRDAELRKMEETRICQLQISNEIQRKNMTGEWFYKAKARRHKDTLHGAELIAASMRRKKPKTIYERLQMKEAKENSNSFSKNAAGDIFIPPELSLFLEEPKNSAVSQKENATQWQQQMAKKNPPSLGKQRENPFNKSFSSTDYPNEQERLPLSIGKQSTSVTSMQESLSHPKDNVSRLYFPTNEHSPAENNSETRPVPKPRTISSKLQVPSDNLSDASGSKNWNGLYNNSSTPKSILKRSPSSSSNDSEILRIGVQDSRNKVPASQTIPEGVTELNEAMANEESLASNNLEKLKQVRFSTNVDEKRISQIQEHYDANELSKIGEDSILDTDYMEEMDEEDTAGVDIMEENETLPEDSGFSDLRHLPLELQTDFMHLNQEVNSMSNTDFQSIQATDSNPQNYSDSYLPHSSSSKLTNQIHELDTGEMPMEKKSSRRSNSPSNSSYYSIDEQIPHTDFASSWVSDQQLPEIIEGKRVNFAEPPTKTAPTEQRLKAHYSKSHVPEKYTSERTKATDESISKVLDWFTRSEEPPSVTLEEEKSPSETMVVNELKPLKTVLPEPGAEFTHNESTLFTEEPQLLLNVNLETEKKEENDIQLQKVQTPIKRNIFDKSAIQESVLLEEKSQTGTKVVPDISYPVPPILNHHSSDKQQFLNDKQNEESEQEPLTLKPFTEERRVVTKEITGKESENTESPSQDIDILPGATIENSPQQSKSSLEKTNFTTEETKTLATIGNKDEKVIPSTVELSLPKDKTSYQKNAFASAVFGRSFMKENVTDLCSIDHGLAPLENKRNNPIEAKPSTFLSNEVDKLDQNKTKKEQINVELNQQNLSGNKKEQRAAIGEGKVLQRQRQVENKPVIGEVPAENMAFSKIETSKPSSKQDKQYSNTSQWSRNVDVPEVEQKSSEEENKTKMNLHLEANNTNTTPKGGKPFTIISIKKRIYDTSDSSLSNTHFTDLKEFWDKGVNSYNSDGGQSTLTKTPNNKHQNAQMARRTEAGFPLEPQPLRTLNSEHNQKITEPSNFEIPHEPTEKECTNPQSNSGPTVKEIMLKLQQNQTEGVKKQLNTKYLPKVLPTVPKEVQGKLKKTPTSPIEDGLSPTSSIPQDHFSEVGEESNIYQPKPNIGLQKPLLKKDESEVLTDIELNEVEGIIPTKDHSFMLRDDKSVDGQDISNLIKNNDEETIPGKGGDNRIQITQKSFGLSYQDQKLPMRQTSDAVSNNEENLTLFAGGSRVAEKNVISQEKLNNFDLPYSAIQSNPNTDVSFQEQISPIKSDEGPMYNEGSEINLDENKEGFESQDEFGPRLNLPSGITRSSTFKKSDGDSDELPIDILRSKNPHDVEQEANNMFSSHSVENNQLNVQTRGSLSDDEITHVVRRRNPQTKDTYKSLEDLNSIDSMPSTLDSKNKEVVLSADDVSNIPVSPENTPLHLKKLKRLSQSVPALAENGDTDSMSERSYQMNKHGTITGSLTNISSSPGMTSRSSVSGSIMSIYSNEFGNIDVRGKIQFSLDYVDKLKEFHIFVVRCSDLAAADEKKNRSDPYVKSYLLPDKVKLGKKKTTVKKKTLSPVYNEILRYKVEKNVLLAQTLNLSVWHNDTFGRNNFLGEVDIELEKWDWSNKQMEWYNLKPRTITSYTSDNKGTLRVAFRYIPQGHKGKKTGEVQIWVKEATNLPQIRAHRLDPFVKCFILPDTTRKSRQKTRVVKKSRNPNFNHTMVYDGFEPEDLKDACVELSVWDHDKLVNHFLGGIRIGLGTGKSYGLAVDWMDSTEEEKQVWNKMITHPNIWVENVLPLRMLMLSKSTTN
ncbi:synaptotagmin-like protein 2 isoform X1 [Hypanus sabinus]|uniref:synaptotagmin-like protein 2 isoform X1 n=1 Tax=Hypanus sabinus TaxID=79690 RepID=UPI0028C39E53|nr:synaptotagmin-like protein 2 isoform X1 [Hypanus sabinus]XP_059820514.1 synaptotagmin-like protein 2 isoform X1 [Hypanus sabinus]XP_059820515.1 synaptotagmin-like protein 2 isoform X1 [Hypanus sabinus]XP_059820516.1 synaptotagmin-like protein 2 isoform X1 [Hypanus sabinus]